MLLPKDLPVTYDYRLHFRLAIFPFYAIYASPPFSLSLYLSLSVYLSVSLRFRREINISRVTLNSLLRKLIVRATRFITIESARNYRRYARVRLHPLCIFFTAKEINLSCPRVYAVPRSAPLVRFPRLGIFMHT